MNEPEALEAGGGRSESAEIGDHYFFVIADDDIVYLTLSGYEYTDLTVYLPGEFGKVSRQFMGEDSLRGNSPSVKLSDPFDLTGLKTGRISINSVYFSLLLFSLDQIKNYYKTI